MSGDLLHDANNRIVTATLKLELYLLENDGKGISREGVLEIVSILRGPQQHVWVTEAANGAQVCIHCGERWLEGSMPTTPCKVPA
jgi:hypothetical protein